MAVFFVYKNFSGCLKWQIATPIGVVGGLESPPYNKTYGFVVGWKPTLQPSRRLWWAGMPTL
ncbi:MAG: hypothetical protein J5680_05410 [Neisseriaceae bacterium]|nr:hypothetical protein [Neisseriaceae bacterium]